MGNTIGGSKSKTTKVMNVNGETTKLRTPVQAMEVTKEHPGHVLLESESVKQFGVRARPLDPAEYLEPKRVYFLVELPKFGPMSHQHREPRRVRSGGIHMGAKERLESLMLARRSASDLSGLSPAGVVAVDEAAQGAVRVKMRLPRAEVERLVRESKDRGEAAERLMDLYVGKPGSDSDSGLVSSRSGSEEVTHLRRQARREKSPLGTKRVSFSPMKDIAEAQLVLAS